MKEFDDSGKDILREWIDKTGKDTAPSGFTEKIMARIEVEITPAQVYKNPISITFRLGALSVLSLLIILSVFSAGSSELAWFDTISEKISQLNISIPQLTEFGSLMSNFSFLIYISIGIFMVVLFDRVLSRIFNNKARI
jgi:hypothetical protein